MPPPASATIVDRSDLTETIAFFRVRPETTPRPFEPGQYVTIGLESRGTVVERPYSIASSARRLDAGYELYIRLVPGGALTPALFGTRVGDRITFRPPKGRFTLTANDPRVHLFVATGCGLAPFISMLRTLRDSDVIRPIVLLHGVSYVRELGYRLFLEDLAADPARRFTYIPTISRPSAGENAGWNGSIGRAETVVSSVCDAFDLTPATSVAYVCGNPEMTTATREILLARAFAPGQMHVEEYWPPVRPATSHGA